MRKLPALAILAVFFSSVASADMIEVLPPAQPEQVSVTSEQILSSPVYQANSERILSMAMARIQGAGFIRDDVKRQIVDALGDLAFHRVMNIELVLPGVPDGVGLCLEGHPTNELAIEGCASTLILVSTLQANIKYRWDLVMHQSENGHVHELSLGPSIGVRQVSSLCFDACSDDRWYGDVAASLEYVFWISRHFGITLQLDVGSTVFLGFSGPDPDPVYVPPLFSPTGKFTVGVAF